MAEGARFPWKTQTPVVVPTLSYKNLSKPLVPPKGTRWHYDRATKEWILVSDGTWSIRGGGDDNGDVGGATVIVDGQDVPFQAADYAAGGGSGAGSSGGPFHVEHIVQPSDTFQGICLRYKITPTQLRQANGGFSGTNLFLAPNPLKIPNLNNTSSSTATKNSKVDKTREGAEANTGGNHDSSVVEELEEMPAALTDGQVISLLQQQFVDHDDNTLSDTEARAYLELNDWELDRAIQAATDDNFVLKTSAADAMN